jgi:hypothetical protein
MPHWNSTSHHFRTPTVGATMVLDNTAYTNFAWTPAEAEAVNTATGGLPGQEMFIKIVTAGTTSYTLTLGANFLATGTLATGTTTAKTFMLHFVSDGTRWIEVSRTAAM